MPAPETAARNRSFLCALALSLLVALSPARAGGAEEVKKVYDLYIMSLCPYGVEALGDLTELIRAFPQREWNVWFIGTAAGGRMTSLRGEEEIFDETLWLGVKALYPFRYHEFLFLRAGSRGSTEALLEEMGLNVGKIRYWAEDAGRSELRKHYERSMRLGVTASPTLFIDNVEYKKSIVNGRLVREECKTADPKPPFCNDYPECFEDSDCAAKGKIGRCVLEGEGDGRRAVCEFIDDAAFKLTVLVADAAMDAPEAEVIEAAEETLPGARVSVVKFSSAEGKALMERYSPDYLPFFVFSRDVANAHRFPSVKESLVEIDGGFTFKPGVVRVNYFPKRAESPGWVVLYADPLMPDIGKVIGAYLSDNALAGRVALRPVLLTDPRHDTIPGAAKLRREEAVRWLAMANGFPKKYHAYLKRYAADPMSSYWFEWLKKIGVSQKKFLRRVGEESAKIAPYWEEFSQVSAGEPVMILINNRLKVYVPNERELEKILKMIPAK